MKTEALDELEHNIKLAFAIFSKQRKGVVDYDLNIEVTKEGAKLEIVASFPDGTKNAIYTDKVSFVLPTDVKKVTVWKGELLGRLLREMITLTVVVLEQKMKASKQN